MKPMTAGPLSPAERRRLLAEARRDGELPVERLDRLLDSSEERPVRLATLVRALDGVFIRLADDLTTVEASLAPSEDGEARGDDLRRYGDLLRSLPRLTRAQEHLLARRLEFARERLAALVADVDMPAETRQRLLERGLNCETLRSELTDDPAGLDVDAILAALPCGSTDPWVRHVVDFHDDLRAHIVERNLYLVAGMAHAYRTYGLPMMDLIQEGNASLIRAVEKFDWRKDVRFGTYAAFWVRQAIERMITANRGIVRVPNYIQQKMRRLRREGKLPRNPRDMDLRDVSELFDTDMQGAARLMETDRSWYSLDVPLGEEGDSTQAASLPSDEPDEVRSDAERRQLGERLDEVMGQTLTEVERDILEQRFGLGGRTPRTLDEIGAEMNVSRERIRQMQVKALGKLQRKEALAPLADFI